MSARELIRRAFIDAIKFNEEYMDAIEGCNMDEDGKSAAYLKKLKEYYRKRFLS